MASNLPRPRLRSWADLMVLRWVLRWQTLGYDSWLQCSIPRLANLRPGEFVFFSCYDAAGLMLPVSSFLLTLLEFYGIQLQHLSPHSFIMVAIFVHFCEMFVGVRLSAPLFWLFHVLHWAGKGMNLIRPYYFQLRAKGSVVYIAAVSPGKWDRWREDWVIVRADPHDRLLLPTGAPTGKCDHWEETMRL
jgi:hypothetical protein